MKRRNCSARFRRARWSGACRRSRRNSSTSPAAFGVVCSRGRSCRRKSANTSHRSLASPRKADEWLVGRLAMKEAARAWFVRYASAQVFPADLTIRMTVDGKPYLAPDGLDILGQLPEISVSHVEGEAVAVAGRPGQAVGIDREVFGRVPIPGFAGRRLQRGRAGAFRQPIRRSGGVSIAGLVREGSRSEVCRHWTQRPAALVRGERPGRSARLGASRRSRKYCAERFARARRTISVGGGLRGSDASAICRKP